MIKTESIGWCIAKIETPEGNRGTPYLRIVSPSDSAEGGFYPAESIALSGWEAIETLHHLLGEAITLKKS